MPINPIQFAHSVCDEFLRYIHSAFPLTDPNLAAQARRMFEAPSSLGIQTRGETLMAAASPAPALRGHHLLCILGFRGLGYDEAFVANMTRVVGLIRKKPETVFTLTDSADILCATCPRCVNGRGGDSVGIARVVAAGIPHHVTWLEATTGQRTGMVPTNVPPKPMPKRPTQRAETSANADVSRGKIK